jgi:hypothetical protein
VVLAGLGTSPPADEIAVESLGAAADEIAVESLGAAADEIAVESLGAEGRRGPCLDLRQLV